MPSQDLRSLWPSLSSREKDARVAEVLGWRIRKIPTLDSEWWDCHAPPPEPPAFRVTLRFDRERTRLISEVRPDGLLLPHYSTSWEHAGPLLEALSAEGWGWTLCAKADGLQPDVALFSPGPEQDDHPWVFEDASVLSAVCLAFVVAKTEGLSLNGGEA
jgi:hypothetical protein